MWLRFQCLAQTVNFQLVIGIASTPVCTEQIIYLGIYIAFGGLLTLQDLWNSHDLLYTLGSPPSPVVQSLTASSQGLYPYFALNCSSSGSASTEVEWTLDSQPVDVDGQIYVTFQMLRDGTTSSYDNLLVVLSGDVNDFQDSMAAL